VRARHAKAPILGRAMRRASAVAAALALALALGATSASAAPAVSVEGASEVTYTTALAKGEVSPEGKDTSYRFEYASQAQYEAEGNSFANAAQAGHGFLGAAEPSTPAQVTLEGLSPNTTYHLRLVAQNEDGTSEAIAASTFTTPFLESPIPATKPAANVGYTRATLNGEVDPDGGGASIFYYFEHSADEGANWAFAAAGTISAEEAEAASGPIPVSLTAEGIPPGDEYIFRLTAQNAAATVASQAPYEGFTTLAAAPPTASLDPVTAITGDSASFKGEVSPNAPEAAPAADPDVEAAFATAYRFECAPACPGTPEQQVIPADNQGHTVEFDPKGLEPNTAYTVKLFAESKGGQAIAERSFETEAPGPTVAAGTVGAMTHDSARLTAYVDPNNTPTTATFEYDTDPSFASPTVAPSGPGSNVTGNGQKVAYADVSGLDPDTTYHWRAKAQSAKGSGEDEADRAFTTYSPPPEPGGCPNEALREKQGSTHLSRCRAWELVSTGEKSVSLTAADIARSGNRAIYRLRGGSDQTSFGSVGFVLSDRTPTGWVTSNALPSRSALGNPEDVALHAYSPELDALTLITQSRISRTDDPNQVYRYAPQTHTLTPEALVGSVFGSGAMTAANVVLASEDQTKIYAAFDQLYSLTGPEPEPAGSLPNGDAPGCPVSFAFPVYTNFAANWVSRDGNRAFFMASDAACSTPFHLYMREGGVEGTTTLLAGPPESGPDLGIGGTSSAGSFQATPDGSQAFFRTDTRITAEDTNEASDLYRHTVGEGNECLTCFLPSADAQGVVVAQSGERAYFTSDRALAPGATAGQANVYLWRAEEPGSVAFVSPALGKGDWLTGDVLQNVIASFDGAAFIFHSNRPELDALTGRSNGGFEQFYRYDDRNGTLDCVTCPPPPRAALEDAPLGFPSTQLWQLENKKPMSEDGRSLFFSTREALVPEDVNEADDAYEWRDGRAELITDGRSPGGLAGVVLRPTSRDGRDVLFVQGAKLTPDARDSFPQLYDARIGGGFPSLYESPPAPCGGDGCREAQGAPPVDATPATQGFSGPGNARPKCAKGKARKKGRCVKRKARKHRSAKRRANSDRGGAK
jgi:hypothetical protein